MIWMLFPAMFGGVVAGGSGILTVKPPPAPVAPPAPAPELPPLTQLAAAKGRREEDIGGLSAAGPATHPRAKVKPRAAAQARPAAMETKLIRFCIYLLFISAEKRAATSPNVRDGRPQGGSREQGAPLALEPCPSTLAQPASASRPGCIMDRLSLAFKGGIIRKASESSVLVPACRSRSRRPAW